MEIYLTQGTTILRLPVIPPSYELGSGAGNQTENVNRLGEVNMLGKRTLKTIPISSIFPNQKYWFCQYSTFPTPSKCVEMVEKMKNNGYVHLVITGSKKINMTCTIENFTWGEDDATKDINYTIELKEYRLLSAGGSSRPTKTIEPMYIVQKGDTLQMVSKKTTGTTENWKKIKKANNLKSNKLKKGQRLIIKI